MSDPDVMSLVRAWIRAEYLARTCNPKVMATWMDNAEMAKGDLLEAASGERDIFLAGKSLLSDQEAGVSAVGKTARKSRPRVRTSQSRTKPRVRRRRA